MSVEGLHHFNLRGTAAQLATLRGFYCVVLGLSEGPRPPFRIAGAWLYAGGEPILHLVEQSEVSSGGAPAAMLDHIALRCSDLESMCARLERHSIQHRIRQVPATGDMQIFCTDPFGLGVELNFSKPP